MKIKNKKKFILSNFILFSILFISLSILLFISNITFLTAEISYTETYIEAGDTLWQIAR